MTAAQAVLHLFQWHIEFFQDKTNSIRVLNAAMVNGYSIVTFQRPLKATDKFDLPIVSNRSQAIVWAIGPLNQRLEVSYHSLYTKGDRFIQFGREPVWNCPISENDMKMSHDENVEELYEPQHHTKPQPRPTPSPATYRPPQHRRYAEIEDDRRPSQSSQLNHGPPKVPPTPRPVSKNKAWEIPPIQCYEPEDGVFYAQMGPTGGKQGYPAITGKLMISRELRILYQLRRFRSRRLGHLLVHKWSVDSGNQCGSRQDVHIRSRRWQ